jgi:nucleotide-binding universal stress UspA family protein
MLSKVLYPTDFSEVSLKALDFIKQLKGGGTKEVVVLHVLDQRGIDAVRHYAIVTAGDFPEWEETVREGANQELAKVEKVLKEDGLKVKCLLKEGIPLKEILRAEQEEAVSLIVIGSHGRSNIEEMLLGSVSEKVLRKCKKPVLVVKREI